MEASKFGFGENVSPAYKFDPTDDDLVANYLLPRALDLHNPYQHAIIDDDTMSLPPWELLRKHGHAASEHAFFFEPHSRANNDGRQNRTVGNAGTWQGQRREPFAITIVDSSGRELDLQYERNNLTFHRTGDGSRTSGWLMYEYVIISPPLPKTMLTRIKMTDKGKKDMQEQLLLHAEAESSSHQVVAVAPIVPLLQLGPSYDYHAVTANGGEEGDALPVEDMQSQQTGEVEAVVAGDAVQTGGNYTPLNADLGGVYYDGYRQYQERFPCPDQEQHHAGDCDGGQEEHDVVPLQLTWETSGHVHRSLDPFKTAANAEYDEHAGDKEDEPNPQAGSSTAMTGASESHGERAETSRHMLTWFDPFESTVNYDCTF